VAVQTAAKSLRDLRVAEVGALDVTVGADGKVKSYRAKVKLSFKLNVDMAAPRRAPAAAPNAVSKKKISRKQGARKRS
jgi:hypothetical protein